MQKVASIKSALAPTCVVKRDGSFGKRSTVDLVPGDVVFLRGGDSIPADVDFLDGDALAVDTAALTGEPFPRKCPDASLTAWEPVFPRGGGRVARGVAVARPPRLAYGSRRRRRVVAYGCLRVAMPPPRRCRGLRVAAAPRVGGRIAPPPRRGEAKHRTRNGRSCRREARPERRSGKRRALAGCLVVSGNAYCLVQRTGVRTETGSATMLIHQSTKPSVSVFEASIIRVCERVMSVALLFLVAVFITMKCRGESTVTTFEACLAILIAAVPVALPVVMQVTLALGAGEMAKQQAIVTHLQAMQEIASMTVLCSDKTGTLTTAKINVFHDQIWCAPGFTKDEILEWAAVASNPHAEDDPIDVAVLRSFKETFPDDFDARIKRYTVSKFVGFDAVRGPRASNRRGAFDETACGAGEGTVDPRIRPSNCPFLKRTRIVRRSAFRAGHETHGRVRDDGRRRPPEACERPDR